MNLPATFVEFKRDECPVCGHRDRCKNSTANPNDLVLCFRVAEVSVNGFRRIKTTRGCSTYVRVGSNADGDQSRSSAPPRQANLDERAARLEAALSEERLQVLARELGVSTAALRALGVGWDGQNPVFPERDARGTATAINTRYPNGRKRVGTGQRRGLYFPDNLAALSNPVLIVEGASDVAACLAMGLTAVGRPNNNGGAKSLAELLADREVIVVGENDRKTGGQWPGRDGAMKVAGELAAYWDRPVKYALPPESNKDVRAYLLVNRHRDQGAVGRELLAHLIAHASDVSTKDVTTKSIEVIEDCHAPGVISFNSSPTVRKWPGPLNDLAFHGVAGAVVRRIEPHTEADPVALLICFLVAVGNAIGRNVYFVADGARHYLNLFAVLIGETSKGRKGTAWARASQRLVAVAAQWFEDRVSGGLSSGEGLIWQVRDPIEGMSVRREKGKPTTSERVVLDEGVADKRLMLIEAEFANVLRVVNREGNTLSAIMRKAWETGTLRSLTKNSPARATGAHISIIGDITVDELRRYLDRTEIANGFGNRFLWLCVRRSKCLPEGGHIEDDAFADLTPRIADALMFASEERKLHRDEAAKQLWAEVYRELSEGKPGLAGALTGRAEAQVMRLASIYAVLDCSSVIRVDHLTSAIALWEYCEESVVWSFGDATGDSLADTILDALRGVRNKGLTRTEISDLFGRNVPAGQLTRALLTLKAKRLAVCQSEETRGRSAERWFAREYGGTKETN